MAKSGRQGCRIIHVAQRGHGKMKEITEAKQELDLHYRGSHGKLICCSEPHKVDGFQR